GSQLSEGALRRSKAGAPIAAQVLEDDAAHEDKVGNAAPPRAMVVPQTVNQDQGRTAAHLVPRGLDITAARSHRQARTRSSSLTGMRLSLTPHAEAIAFAITAGAGMAGGSPTPRAPRGPSGEGTSTSRVSTGGAWSMVGMA